MLRLSREVTNIHGATEACVKVSLWGARWRARGRHSQTNWSCRTKRKSELVCFCLWWGHFGSITAKIIKIIKIQEGKTSDSLPATFVAGASEHQGYAHPPAGSFKPDFWVSLSMYQIYI